MDKFLAESCTGISLAVAIGLIYSVSSFIQGFLLSIELISSLILSFGVSHCSLFELACIIKILGCLSSWFIDKISLNGPLELVLTASVLLLINISYHVIVNVDNLVWIVLLNSLSKGLICNCFLCISSCGRGTALFPRTDSKLDSCVEVWVRCVLNGVCGSSNLS